MSTANYSNRYYDSEQGSHQISVRGHEYARSSDSGDDNDSNNSDTRQGISDASIPTMSNEPCPRCAGRDASIWTGSLLETWLACDICDIWFHAACVGLRAQECDQIEEFHCPDCAVMHGPSIYKKEIRKSQREHARINYQDLINADVMLPCDRIARLANFSFVTDNFPRLSGDKATIHWAYSSGLETPTIFTGPTVCGMHMPPSTLTVTDIARLVGHDTPVNVMDVNSQADITGWTLANWEAYFSASEKRTRTLNVISLEVSQTRLAEQIRRPQLVRELDWVSLAWPEERRQRNDYPKVQLYCLMSVKDCYTDFHIDFGGSSVFYHILSGAKTFYFIPPTSTNLKKYEKWCKSPEQASTFFAEAARPCYRVDLKANDTMIIPTGWIHAVYTPADAIVIGGNFLHGLHIGRQLDIYKLEKRTAVLQPFRFPYFEQLCWYAAMRYHRLLTEQFNLNQLEFDGLDRLLQFLRETQSNQQKDVLPPGMCDPDNFINQFKEQIDRVKAQRNPKTEEKPHKLKVKLKLTSIPSSTGGKTLPAKKDSTISLDTTAVSSIDESKYVESKQEDNRTNNTNGGSSDGKLRIRILPQQLRTTASATHFSDEESDNSLDAIDTDDEDQHHDKYTSVIAAKSTENKTITHGNSASSLADVYHDQYDIEEEAQQALSSSMPDPVYIDDIEDEDFEPIDQDDGDDEDYDTTYASTLSESARKRARHLSTNHRAATTATTTSKCGGNTDVTSQDTIFDPLDVLGLMSDDTTMGGYRGRGRGKGSNADGRNSGSNNGQKSATRGKSYNGKGGRGSGVVSKILREMKRRR